MGETVASRPPEAEQLRSFDVLASIDMLKFDLQAFGQIMPETMQRVFDEELTYMAEGVDRPLRTEFTLREHEGELAYFDNGQWRPYIGTLLTGFETAKHEAAADPRKNFLTERAAYDLYIGNKLRALQPGERLAWSSDFPEAECQRYGEEFVAQFGFQPARRMGFLYTAEKAPDGSLRLISQSVDSSNEQAFAAAQAVGEEGGDINAMLAAYDTTLGERRGGRFYAGRRMGAHNHEENAWAALQQQRDLLDHYFEKLEALAKREDLPRSELGLEKKRLTYGVWAALKKRLDAGSFPTQEMYAERRDQQFLEEEIRRAYSDALLQGAVLFGCGASMSPAEMEALLENADPEAVRNMVFGNSEEDAGPCDFISKKCPECGAKNVRTRRTKTHIRGSCGCSKRL